MSTDWEILFEAERRYMTDPEFHAKAFTAAGLFSRYATQPVSERDMSMCRMAACIALVLAERPLPSTHDTRPPWATLYRPLAPVGRVVEPGEDKR